ncbi:hypothetical protein NTGM5_480070 [Candidatus Nitrotoga sp. M5]|nr:hypothetical protein NTGM5_480070 [Candidatus Nitrotoga sp. M5]
MPEFLFVITDALLDKPCDEMLGGVARQRRATEMRIARYVIFWLGVQVGEVTAATTGDADFFRQFF